MAANFFPASDRGHATYDWLSSYFYYSFASYYDPSRMGFGPLRVINDDTIAPSSGFPMHSHQNMEIITIVTSGTLIHKDSLGNTGHIDSGTIQVMSAGTGITHSEYNASPDKPLELFQIWIIPNQTGHQPRYQEQPFTTEPNIIQTLVGPEGSTQGALQIYQDASISKGSFTKDVKQEYSPRHTHGVKIVVISGTLSCQGYDLRGKDSIEITGQKKINLEITAGAEFLLFDM